MFSPDGCRPHPNHLRFRLGHDDGVTLSMQAKAPGDRLVSRTVGLDVDFQHALGSRREPYKRLLGDALDGNPARFAREDGVEAAWRDVQPLLDGSGAVHRYARGSWGPEAADALVAGPRRMARPRNRAVGLSLGSVLPRQPRGHLTPKGQRCPVTAAAVLAGAAWVIPHLRSPAVRVWRRPSLPAQRVGRLFARIGGDGDHGVLLLHGLVATGDVFGATAERLATRRRVAVPDLLGFGRSLDEVEADFGTDAHLDSLAVVVNQVLGDRRFSIGAHSMGCTLALRLALQMPDRVERVVGIGAPVWRHPRTAVSATGPMARALLLDERIAARLCRFNCRHRTASGWLSAASAPRWPIPVAREASLHTWAAYRQALEAQVLDVDWPELLTAVGGAGTPVSLIWGGDDPVGDPKYAQQVTEGLDTVSVELISNTDHTAPAARPDLLVARLGDPGW